MLMDARLDVNAHFGKGTMFRYQENLTADELRVLVIEPATDRDAPIVCQLQKISRNESEISGGYDALSYTWGDPSPTHRILVDNQEFMARDSLISALRQLRYTHRQRRVWADAVCINQDHQDMNASKERDLQVSRMGETYTDATQVFAWLGDASDDSWLALRAIHELSEPLERLTVKQVANHRLELPVTVSGYGPERYLEAIENLVRRSWFERLWIVQEVLLGKPQSVFLHCGDDFIPFTRLMNFQLAFTDPKRVVAPESLIPLQSLEIYSGRIAESLGADLMMIRQALNVTPEELAEVESKTDINNIQRKTCRLLVLLSQTRKRKCDNPRDRIYALRALTRDVAKEQIKPEYQLSVVDTYERAVRAMIAAENGLDVLSMCPAADPSPALPSWIPNFHEGLPKNPWPTLTWIFPSDIAFKASTLDPTSLKPDERGSALTLSGYEIGAIDYVKHLKYDCIYKTTEVWDAISSHPVLSQLSEEVRRENLWRTLLTNRKKDSQTPEPQTEGRQFEAWWDALSRLGTGMRDLLDNEQEAEASGSYDEHTKAQMVKSLLQLTNQYGMSLRNFPDFIDAFFQHGVARWFITTTTGDIGLSMREPVKEDRICLLAGAQAPFVLRKLGDCYQLIGECYIHGIMDGSKWKTFKDTRRDTSNIVLI